MTALARLPGVAVAAAAVIGIAWASTAPMAVHDSPGAVLRLAWSARPERIQTCRQQSDEELARLPSHMRQEVVCEGTTAQYRLQVRYGGRVVADEVVHGGGLRRDRRLYVFHELPVVAGDAVLDVRFDRLGPDPAPPADPGRSGAAPVAPAVTADMPGSHNDGSKRRQGGDTVPPHLALRQHVTVSPHRVVLVTYDPERRALIALQGASRRGRPARR